MCCQEKAHWNCKIKPSRRGDKMEILLNLIAWYCKSGNFGQCNIFSERKRKPLGKHNWWVIWTLDYRCTCSFRTYTQQLHVHKYTDIIAPHWDWKRVTWALYSVTCILRCECVLNFAPENLTRNSCQSPWEPRIGPEHFSAEQCELWVLPMAYHCGKILRIEPYMPL